MYCCSKLSGIDTWHCQRNNGKSMTVDIAVCQKAPLGQKRVKKNQACSPNGDQITIVNCLKESAGPIVLLNTKFHSGLLVAS